MVLFAEYCFNKSHSTAYGAVTYQTAYLKAHYPVAYMAALLTVNSGSTDKIQRYISNCNSMGIQVMPPDVNASGICLLYTSDAADDLLCVDLGGRRIIKKPKNR